jgi:hypothetical protein
MIAETHVVTGTVGRAGISPMLVGTWAAAAAAAARGPAGRAMGGVAIALSFEELGGAIMGAPQANGTDAGEFSCFCAVLMIDAVGDPIIVVRTVPTLRLAGPATVVGAGSMLACVFRNFSSAREIPDVGAGAGG